MTTSTHRPELHLTAEIGVLNAPAGILLDGSDWHLFHQFQTKLDQPARWAHVIAEHTPFHWEICNDVIAPRAGELKVRAGSVTSHGAGAHLYFTSVTDAGTTIQLARLNNLLESMTEVDEEGSTIDPGVKRIGRIVPASEEFHDFRSPCVVPGWLTEEDRSGGHEGWLMLALTGPVETPTMVVLTSPDGQDWHLLGPLTFENPTGLPADTPVVSPRIIRLHDEVDEEIRDILLVTIEQKDQEIAGYLVGELHGATFRVTSPFTRLDYGHDFTRPRNTNITPGTLADPERYNQAVLIGLMNGSGRQDKPEEHLSWQEEGWANCLSLPRVVTLQGGVLYQTPTAGLIDAIAESDSAAAWTGLADIPVGGQLQIDILDGEGRPAARISHHGDSVVLDRSMNPHHKGDPQASAPLIEGDTDALTIIVDGSTVEVFADGGVATLSSRVYFDGGASGFMVSTAGDAELRRSYERRSRNHYSEAFAHLDDTDFAIEDLWAEDEDVWGEDDSIDEGLVR
ncbi:glycoside hydrolase family 32 protein [Corynebacterium poyangense]|uniref:beta-fructofuranosidase n=1 Tax=Corynebacterium poyangense TaxID=2684405 RepID=A0A7H0SN72_9CORY|nr:GH32 C-terminal domain-containing protein [Corynebacterium poyangense]QNQ89997.1 glycoside hydrolase family 32 protein [Corynebacterium poyangense]